MRRECFLMFPTLHNYTIPGGFNFPCSSTVSHGSSWFKVDSNVNKQNSLQVGYRDTLTSHKILWDLAAYLHGNHMFLTTQSTAMEHIGTKFVIEESRMSVCCEKKKNSSIQKSTKSKKCNLNDLRNIGCVAFQSGV